MERTGIDEGYLDLGTVARDFTQARAVASAVQTAVRAKTSLTCSLGVATSKVVCKIASDRRKPGGITLVPPGKEARFLAPLAVRLLPGIGPRAEERLRAAGVATIGRLAELDDSQLRALLPGSVGRMLRDRALGIDPRDLDLELEPVSVSAEDTFPRDLTDRERLHDEVRRLAELVAERLHNSGLSGRTVTAKLRYADFSIRTRSTTLPAAVDEAALIGEVACGLLDRGLRDRPGRAATRRRRRIEPVDVPAARVRRVVESPPVLEAAFWGLVTAGSLWVGAALALLRPPSRAIGLAMAFGAGALIAAVSYELVLDAVATDVQLAALGFACGALVFYGGDWAIERRGGGARKSMTGEQAARRERERDRARHGARRHSGVVRPRRLPGPGGRRSRRGRGRRVRVERPGGALGNDGSPPGRLEPISDVRHVVRRRPRLGRLGGARVAAARDDGNRRRRLRDGVRSGCSPGDAR